MRMKIYCEDINACLLPFKTILCCKLSCPEKENSFILYAFESTNVKEFCLNSKVEQF